MCTLCQAADPFGPEYRFHEIGTGPAPVAGTGAVLPTWTVDRIAAYLSEGYWTDSGLGGRGFDVAAGGMLSVDLSQLGATARGVARDALDAWSAVSGLGFADGPAGGADITFGEAESGAYASSVVSGGTILSSSVNVAQDWAAYGGYYLQTYIHEIGHALGLGHAGDYNGAARYDRDAHYANDSWQMSAMSYFSQADTPVDDGSRLYLDTPQMADIAAIGDIYGTPAGVRAGDTAYGDGAGPADPGMDLAPGRARTIHDTGGTDAIDLSARGADQTLDLRPGRFSDIDGGRGNLGITSGTLIEFARTGPGDDAIIGNGAANLLSGGAGDDAIRSGGGDDMLAGGDGSDRLHGGGGTDRAVFDGPAWAWQAVWDAGAANGGPLDLTRTATQETDRLIAVEHLAFDTEELAVAALLSELDDRFGPIAPGSDEVHRVGMATMAAAMRPTGEDSDFEAELDHAAGQIAWPEQPGIVDLA